MSFTVSGRGGFRGAPSRASSSRAASAGVRPACQLLDREARKHGLLRRLGAPAVDVGIPLLDEQPVALALLDLHQGPHPVELPATQLEEQLALGQSLGVILHSGSIGRDPTRSPLRRRNSPPG